MNQLGACATRMLTTSVDCDNAKASVQQMNNTFLALGSPAAFAAEVSSITASLQSALPWIEGPGLCGSAWNIGIQADGLTNAMLSAAGQSGVAGPTCGDPGFGISNILGTGLTVGAVALGALAIFLLLGPRR